MKKGFILVYSSILLLFSATQVFAQTKINIAPPTGLPGGGNINTIISFILTILVVIGVFLSVVFLIYGGIKWITSGGDKGAIEAARNQIVGAIIGLVVVILTFVILSLVLQLVGVGGVFNLTIPSLLGPPPTPLPTPTPCPPGFNQIGGACVS